MGKPFLLQRVILEIPHHGIHLRHGIAHRGPGGKHYATPAGHFVQISALHEHVRAALGL